jgi:hypothetical protein
MRLTFFWLLPTLPILCSSCSSGGSPESGEAIPVFNAQLDLRIGSVEDDEYALTWFRNLLVADDGRIYTLHPMEDAIRVHDRSGTLVTTVGGHGEGPGEFDSPGPMGFVGDTLWVMDHGTYRLSYFSLDGEFLRSENFTIDLSGPMEASPPRPGGLFADGTIRGSSPAWSHLVADGTITESAELRLNAAGEILDTIVAYPLANTVLEVTNPNDERGVRSYRPQPFSDAVIPTVSPYEPEVVWIDRPAATEPAPATFRVTKLDFEGDTIFSRPFPYTPVPVEAALVDSLVQEYAEQFTRGPMPGAASPTQAQGWVREALYVPSFHPPVSTVVIGMDGTLWLRREDVGAETIHWMILDSEGRTVGLVELDRGLTVMAATRDRIWGSLRDDLDVPYIVRYCLTERDARGAPMGGGCGAPTG